MTKKILYFVKADQAFYDLIRSTMPDDYELLTFDGDDEEEKLQYLSVCDGAIVGGRRMGEEDIAAAPHLQVVLHQGVGYHDTVATEMLKERGIRLALTPQGTSEGVAEHAIMMMLAAGRRVAFVDAELRQGRWHSNTFRSNARQLLGGTVGIIGLGRIGKQVAKRLIAFGCRVLYHDLLEMPAEVERELQVTRVDRETLLRESDFVTLHLPLTDSSHYMIDEAALALMPKGSILVNCARGPVVKETALVAALESGHLGGAGLDVFEVEPPAHPTPLAKFPNVVLTPHHAPGTRDTMELKFNKIFENADNFFAGRPMENEVNFI
jgi:phosphoglycerate dehydrogenase-like enzyme